MNKQAIVTSGGLRMIPAALPQLTKASLALSLLNDTLPVTETNAQPVSPRIPRGDQPATWWHVGPLHAGEGQTVTSSFLSLLALLAFHF